MLYRLTTGKDPLPNLSKPPQNFHHLSTLSLWKHQQAIVDHILTKGQAFIAAEMRTGKTRATLSAIDIFYRHLHTDDNNPECLWICPKSAKRAIELEFKKVFKDTPIAFKFYLMTYEEATPILNNPRLPRVVILDEAHRVKSTTSQRGKQATEIYSVLESVYGSDFLLVGLSGTPSPHSPVDWYNICSVFAPSILPFGREKDFELSLALETEELTIPNPKTGENMTLTKVKSYDPVKTDALRQVLSKFVLTIWKKDVLTVPDPIDLYIRHKIPASLNKAIKFVKSTTLTTIGVINALRQLADGFQYNNTPNIETGTYDRLTSFFKSPKMDTLREQLSEADAPFRPVIFGAFQATVDQITTLCVELGYTVLKADGRGWSLRSATLNTSNEEQVLSVLREFDQSYLNEHPKAVADKLCIVGNPATVCTGLELSASEAFIYFSHTDNGEAEFQSRERALSANIKHQLKIYHYIQLPTDEIIIERLATKKKLQSITMGEIITSLEKIHESVVLDPEEKPLE
jgi:hypothetical protein